MVFEVFIRRVTPLHNNELLKKRPADKPANCDAALCERNCVFLLVELIEQSASDANWCGIKPTDDAGKRVRTRR